jgi:uncharacterized small protein (DUF1192 family)
MNYMTEPAMQNNGLVSIKEAYVTRTIGENIDARVASLKAEIARLEGVKSQLGSGASLLDVKIDDLRQAMNY